MSSRQQNERRFGRWEELPGGGRRSRLDVAGRPGWQARYLKEVDAGETTVRFGQEIYDDTGNLVEAREIPSGSGSFSASISLWHPARVSPNVSETGRATRVHSCYISSPLYPSLYTARSPTRCPMLRNAARARPAQSNRHPSTPRR